jgi:hypothetical protein
MQLLEQINKILIKLDLDGSHDCLAQFYTRGSRSRRREIRKRPTPFQVIQQRRKRHRGADAYGMPPMISGAL